MQLVPFRRPTVGENISSTSATQSSMPRVDYPPTIPLGNKLQRLAFEHPEALRVIEAVVDRWLAQHPPPNYRARLVDRLIP